MIDKIYRKIKSIIKNILMKRRFKKKGCKIARNVTVSTGTKLEHKIVVNRKCNISNSSIGYGSYISHSCNYTNSIIGRFTSIASHSEVIRGSHPTKKFVSTHPAFYSIMKQSGFTFVDKNIFQDYNFADEDKKISVIVGNDVWIGYGAKILEGVNIGDGAIIAAGAVVTKDVEPYSIVGGMPAKHIKYRFEKKYIDFLLEFRWWEKSFEWIEKNAKLFDDIEKLYEKYK